MILGKEVGWRERGAEEGESLLWVVRLGPQAINVQPIHQQEKNS